MEADGAAMVELIRRYGVRDERVLEAMGRVRRHRFIPEAYRNAGAYGDHPCPIGYGQTISQPFIVAYMTERIAPRPGMKILEIGTGSGYQAAVLAELGAEVCSIERVPELADHARRVLAAEGYRVEIMNGDGSRGWPEKAPFDSIIVTCAPERIPLRLAAQLRDGGRMMLPVGSAVQHLVVLERAGDTFLEQYDLPVRFVPLVKGE